MKCPFCGKQAAIWMQSDDGTNTLRAATCLYCGKGHTPRRFTLAEAERYVSAITAHRAEEATRLNDMIQQDMARIEKNLKDAYDKDAPKRLH